MQTCKQKQKKPQNKKKITCKFAKVCFFSRSLEIDARASVFRHNISIECLPFIRYITCYKD